MNLKNIINNALSLTCSNEVFLKNNNSFWRGYPVNTDLLHFSNSQVEFLFDYEKKYFYDTIKKIPSNRYFDKKVFYTLDNNSFRIYNLPKKDKKIFCLGCSCTFGMGLSDDETWPFMFSEKTNHEYSIYNFGTIGASVDTIARFVHQLKDQNPICIIILFPNIFRKEYITEDNKILNFNVRSSSKNSSVHDEYYSKSKGSYSGYLNLLNNNESFFNFVKNLNFIKSTLNKIPFFWGSLCDYLTLNETILGNYFDTSNMLSLKLLKKLPNSYARDGEHYSYNYNEFISDKFYAYFKKNIIKN